MRIHGRRCRCWPLRPARDGLRPVLARQPRREHDLRVDARNEHPPRFHAGDLAIVQPGGGLPVGEIMAYYSTTLHTVVFHRISRFDGGSRSRATTTTLSIPTTPRRTPRRPAPGADTARRRVPRGARQANRALSRARGRVRRIRLRRQADRVAGGREHHDTPARTGQPTALRSGWARDVVPANRRTAVLVGGPWSPRAGRSSWPRSRRWGMFRATQPPGS